ncbi:MAG: hypothetical protein Fur0025_36740 [Oscillatoriaceae cyanobacterium]
MNETQDTLKTPSNGSNGARSALNDGGYVSATEVMAKLQSDLKQIKDLQPLPKGMTLSWKFPLKSSGDTYGQLQFKFWQPNGTEFKQHAVGLGKVSWSSYLLLADKLRLLHAKLREYHPSQYSTDKVAEFWQWIDIELRGKSDVALGEQSPSPLFADVIGWLRASKRKVKDKTWKRAYSAYLPEMSDNKTLLQAIELLPSVLSDADGKNSRRDALTCWHTIATLPQLAGSGEAEEIFKILKKFPPITECKQGYERNEYVPNTKDIWRTYKIGCDPSRYLDAVVTRYQDGKAITYTRKKTKSYDMGLRYQWAFLVLATYGIRVHELSAIANWTSPVTLKSGDWVALSGGDKLGDDDEGTGDVLASFEQLDSMQIIPAWNDPTIPNEARVLAIKADTKTGFRLAVPLNPTGQDWVQLLLDTVCGELHPLWGGCPFWKDGVTPDRLIEYISTGADPEHYAVVANQQRILWDKVFGGDNWPKFKFSAHKLRHAWNHRAHAQGLPVELIAKSLGHRITTNLSTYFKNKSDEAEMAIMQNAANDLIGAIKKQHNPTIPLESAIAVVSSLMDENGKVDASALLAAIYGLKPDSLPIKR